MIKALLTGRGKPTLVLGLTDENIARLLDNQPIMFDADQFGYPANIAIIAGHTKDDIREDLRAIGVDLLSDEGDNR